MNLQTIRYRFSIFLKQFRIDDLKLLMKFLNQRILQFQPIIKKIHYESIILVNIKIKSYKIQQQNLKTEIKSNKVPH
jgi:hypothetical protein